MLTKKIKKSLKNVENKWGGGGKIYQGDDINENIFKI